MKRLISLIIASLTVLCPIIALSTGAASSDSSSSPIKVEITQTPSKEGDADAVDVSIKVTNISDYPVFGAKVNLDSAEGLEIISLESDEVSRLSPQECIETSVRLKSGEHEQGGEDKKGCRNSLAAAGIIAVVIVGCAFSFAVKGRKRATGAFIFAIVLCASVFMLPMLTGAEGASEAATAPAVKITGGVVIGNNENYRQLAFDCEYTEGSSVTLKNDIELTLGQDNPRITVSVIYSEYGDFSMGVRALPITGLETLPLAIQKGRAVDLTAKSLGTELAVEYPEKAYTFRGTVDDRLYPQYYAIKYSAMAYLVYSHRNETVTVYSEAFTGSARNAAQEMVKDTSLSQEVRDDLQKNVINKAGKTYPLPEEDEKAVRQGIVDRMVQMASVIWYPERTVSTQGQINYSTPSYIGKQKYAGLIYNQFHFGTAEAFSYLLDANGMLDPSYTKNVTTAWNNTPGVSCSTSITGAYAYFCPGIKQVVSATKMNPATANTGFTKIGSYAVPSGAKTTVQILDTNQEQTIYEAYAQMKQADILCANWYNNKNELLGHVIMAREDPIVVKKSDGTLDPNRSRIKTIEQHATVIQQNGVNTTWKLAETSFHDLMYGSLRYVPVRYTNLSGDAATPSYCFITGMDADALLTKGLTGTLETNFVLRYFGITVTDTSGKTVYDIKITPSDGYAKGLILSSQTAVSAKLRAIPAGTYNVKVTACVKNAERVLLDTIVSK